MKHRLLLAAALLLATSALADSPDAILKDYRTRAAQAVERLNFSLKNTATPLITKLVSSGDTDGAALLTSQLKDKLAGEPVPTPQASAAPLFSLYDEARTKALAPVQKSSIARIESMLKTAGGPKLETITELGKVRAEIEAGKVFTVASLAANIPMDWTYHTSSDRQKYSGDLKLNADGSLTLSNADQSTVGKWEITSKPNVLKVFLNTTGGVEKCLMKINGAEAELERPIGTRYLKAK
jgi:hypothetical protein